MKKYRKRNRKLLNKKTQEWKAQRTERVKRYNLRAQHGVTLEFYLDLVEKQNNLCAICKCSLEGRKKAHLDHCHSTGKIRAVLCHNCNLGLGNFQDSEEFLLSAIRYLKEYG